MDSGLTQRILDLLYRDTGVHRKHKDDLGDWILDTQSRSESLSPTALMAYLQAHQPDVLARLTASVHVGDEVARVLGVPIPD